MINELSKKIHSELDIQHLCVTGLGMKAHVVASCIHQNRKDLAQAMYHALMEWRDDQKDDTKVNENLYNALSRVNKNSLIHEALERQNDYSQDPANPEIDSKLTSN